MIRIFILLFVALAAIAFIVYQLLSFGLFMKSGIGRGDKDIQELKNSLTPLLSKLVPLTHEELRLLSLNQSNRTVSRGINTITTGTFDSIYHEPLLAYAYKDFGGSDHALMVAMTENDTWTYSIAMGKTKVSLNEKPVGIIAHDGVLRGIESKRQLALVEMDHNVSSHPVFIGQKEIGYVNNPMMAGDVNPRAFHLFNDLEKDEQDLFLSLSILSLVEEAL